MKIQYTKFGQCDKNGVYIICMDQFNHYVVTVGSSIVC